MKKKEEGSTTTAKKIVAGAIGGALVTAAMAAVGPVAVLALGVGLNVYLFRKVLKDTEKKNGKK